MRYLSFIANAKAVFKKNISINSFAMLRAKGVLGIHNKSYIFQLLNVTFLNQNVIFNN